ncbi:hypothetical protein BAU14_11565 [Enterococcus sp. CU9D]|nr:hypothetical protein BAU14_11565 [Enterococcus sp. CU9D]
MRWRGNFNAQVKQQHIQTLTDLLKNGFSLSEALWVMRRSGHFVSERLVEFHNRLAIGAELAECFECLSFTSQEKAQIQLAQHHGDLTATLANIAQQMQLTAKQRQELLKTLTYPVLLLIFVTALLLGMRQFLLPPLLATGMMAKDHWGVRFLTEVPYWLAGLVGCLCIGFLLLRMWFRRCSVLQRCTFWSRLPLVGGFYRLLVTSYFALEWGKLFQEGLELRQIIETMQITSKKSLMYQLSRELDLSLQEGIPLARRLAQYHFLTPEFSLIIFQGETKGRLGTELVLYSRLTQKRFYQRMEKLLHLVQPLIFLLVALLIVSVYAAIFLPLYGNLNEVL